jgi:hypothetical protein
MTTDNSQTKFHCRIYTLDRERVELAFRAWTNYRLIPEDMADMLWEEFSGFLRQVPEMEAKLYIKAQKVLEENDEEI